MGKELTREERVLVYRKHQMFNKRADRWLETMPVAFKGHNMEDLLESRWSGAIASSDIATLRRWMSEPTPFIILHGPSGLGKTLMGMLICEKMLRSGKVNSAFYIPTTKLLDGLSDYSDRDQGGVLGRVKKPDLLFLDDIGSGGMDMTATRRTGLWELIDHRWSTGKPTIITTNLAVNEKSEDDFGDAAYTIEDYVGVSAWDRMSDRQVDIPFIGETHREKEEDSIADKRKARARARRQR